MSSGTNSRIPHQFPTTPSTSHSDFRQSFFSVVHPPDGTPGHATPDEESSIDGHDDGLVISSRSTSTSSSAANSSAALANSRKPSWQVKKDASDGSVFSLSGLGASLASLLRLDAGQAGEGSKGGKRPLSSPVSSGLGPVPSKTSH